MRLKKIQNVMPYPEFCGEKKLKIKQVSRKVYEI